MAIKKHNLTTMLLILMTMMKKKSYPLNCHLGLSEKYGIEFE